MARSLCQFPQPCSASPLGRSAHIAWASASSAVVATDDDRIAACCRGFGAHVVMTPTSCMNGTERCHAALAVLGGAQYDFVVNIQGDEPLVEPAAIDAVVQILQDAPDAVSSTAVAPMGLHDPGDVNRVKCVADQRGYAIYFSRAVLPSNKSKTVNHGYPYLLHLGLQCYNVRFLAKYARSPPTPLQMEEDLEQLKIIEQGYKIKVVCVDHTAHGVDVPEDIAKIEALLHKHGTL